jgi:hypothetical protein
LNHVLASAKKSFVDSPPTLDHRALLIEHVHKTVTLIPTTKRSFNVLAEGLPSEKSRGDKTPPIRSELSRQFPRAPGAVFFGRQFGGLPMMREQQFGRILRLWLPPT